MYSNNNSTAANADGHADVTAGDVTAPAYVSDVAASNPLRQYQWYLDGYLTPGSNVYGANIDSISVEYGGSGVRVGIIDEGFDISHPDLAGQFDLSASYDPRDDGAIDIMPDDSSDDHGTMVAGVIGARGDDGFGTIGVAPDATLVGFYARFGTGGSPRAELADLLARQVDVDISNNSWGYTTQFADNFRDPAWASIKNGIVNGITEGRDGLGTIYVFAAGNDRQYVANTLSYDGDNTNSHSLTNNRYSIAAAASTADGHVAAFSTPGASILVAAPGVSILTTDLNNNDGNANNDHATVSGTSFSAPIVSAVVALMLEANPNLGYRDVQEILALSSRKIDLAGGSWTTNGATNWNGGGNLVSHDFGFGLIDAHAAVRLAETWTAQSTAANEDVISIAGTVGDGTLVDNVAKTFSVTVESSYEDFSIDWVEIDVSFLHTHTGDLRLELLSPTGTRSLLMDRPAAGNNTRDNLTFTFSTTHDWGEAPEGTWQLIVTDLGTGGAGSLESFAIRFYGDQEGDYDVYYYTDEFAAMAGDRTTLSDSAGVDTINAAAVTTALLINLLPGAVSTIGGRDITGTAGTEIENAYAGDGDDRIYGNGADNYLSGGHGDDSLWGGFGDDTLVGGIGDDILDGSFGADLLYGGLGNDIYVVDSFDDVVFENAGDGIDIIISMIDGYPLAANVEYLYAGATGGQIITGNALDNLMSGNIGADTLSGSDGNDAIYGGLGDDILEGGAGNDILDGGIGTDVMAGGEGSDIYVVDSIDDVVNENANEGLDIVIPLIGSYLMSANVEYSYVGITTGAVLIGNESDNLLSGNIGNDELYGESGYDLLHGGAGNDLLDGGEGVDYLNGGSGNDTMIGGLGDDVYVVEELGDIVVEGADEGMDTVLVVVDNYVLAENVEYGNAILTTGQTLTGNSLNNILLGRGGADTFFGLDGNDQLYGRGGDDTLEGGAGNDVLDGGTGDDMMVGGVGDDSYIVDSLSDTVVENFDEGTDTVIAMVDNLVLAADVEHGNVGLSSGLTLTGNALDNVLSGHNGNDALNGAEGADTLYGGFGDDVLDGGAGADHLYGGAGTDTFVFRCGEADGDTVHDFAGLDAGGLDQLLFVGYGTAAEGAEFVQLDATHWQLTSADGLIHETIVCSNAAALQSQDYLFV